MKLTLQEISQMIDVASASCAWSSMRIFKLKNGQIIINMGPFWSITTRTVEQVIDDMAMEDDEEFARLIEDSYEDIGKVTIDYTERY